MLTKKKKKNGGFKEDKCREISGKREQNEDNLKLSLFCVDAFYGVALLTFHSFSRECAREEMEGFAYLHLRERGRGEGGVGVI